ncbi:MAG TPA: ABC transporter permease [Anaerolineales bacterium]|nr:ABC transporter permease [Anaerolineales bacterium]
MRANLRLFWSGVRASWADYMVELTPTLYLGVHIPRTIFQALFFVLIAKAAGGDQLARFALIGNAVQMAVFFGLLSMEIIIESEKWSGTFEYLIASPAHWLPLMLGKSMFSFSDAFLSTIVVFAVLIPVLNLQISLVNLLASAPVILITVISAGAMGWLIGAICLPIRWGFRICNLLAYAMMILCGVNFPFTALPPIVQEIGRLLPVTHGLLAVRAIIDGATYWSVLPLVGSEILIAVTYSGLAWIAFGYRLKVARQSGAFELV